MENTENSFIPPPLPVSTQLTTSPTISIPSPEWCICQGTYDEPTLIHLYYPKIHSSYLELNLSVAHPMHLGKSVARLHHHRIIQNSHIVLRALLVCPSLPLTSDNHCSFFCLHGCAFSRVLYSWNYTV